MDTNFLEYFSEAEVTLGDAGRQEGAMTRLP